MNGVYKVGKAVLASCLCLVGMGILFRVMWALFMLGWRLV